MKDRVPTYPGRVRMTPVTGQTNVYDMELADQPTEAGTPLNKANLLTDATATALGLDPSDNPSPDDAFDQIAQAKQDNGVQYTATLPSSGWSLVNGYYTQTVTVSGLLASYATDPIVDVALSGNDAATDDALVEAWAYISLVETGTDSVTAYCTQAAPSVNVPIIIIVFP